MNGFTCNFISFLYAELVLTRLWATLLRWVLLSLPMSHSQSSWQCSFKVYWTSTTWFKALPARRWPEFRFIYFILWLQVTVGINYNYIYRRRFRGQLSHTWMRLLRRWWPLSPSTSGRICYISTMLLQLWPNQWERKRWTNPSTSTFSCLQSPSMLMLQISRMMTEILWNAWSACNGSYRLYEQDSDLHLLVRAYSVPASWS